MFDSWALKESSEGIPLGEPLTLTQFKDHHQYSVGSKGVEPLTFCTSSRRSNQLS